MPRFSASVRNIYQFRWSPNPDTGPERSGVYLTRNSRDQEWFRYFDARLGDWYASWAEMKTRVARDASTRIHHTELASEVVAWAHRARALRA